MGLDRERKAMAIQYQQHPQRLWRSPAFPAMAGAYLSKLSRQDECFDSGTNSSSVFATSAMRDPLFRTKVVVRRLPPTLSKQAFVSQINSKFANTYSWLVFRPGKTTHGKQVHSRAYIDFNRPEDVLYFHEDFDGHVFVNEKGSQYKASVEYAPNQRVPDLRAKKDGRAGTIYKDPDYLEFLETLGKPNELLPSAEIQLEKRDLAGSSKETPIVTPLMEYVRQKRAAKLAQQRGKFRQIAPPANFVLQKRGDRGRSTAAESSNGPAYGRRETRKRGEYRERRPRGEEPSNNGSYDEGEAQSSELRISEPDTQRSNRRHRERGEASSSGFAPRSRPTQASTSSSSSRYRDRGPRTSPPRARAETSANGTTEGRRLRNKDRPDRSLWTIRRRGDPVDSEADSGRAAQAEPENDLEGRNGTFENGTYRRRGPDTASLKRGGASFGNNEKQVWVAVQKTG